jgi:hypothetical protein
MLPQLENLARVAAALREIRGERFVFAGASILPLFLDADFPGRPRPTKDTDVVVPVLHYGQWSRLRDALIAVGFRERADIEAPRQIVFWLGDIRADFMPVRMPDFGMEDRWLSLGFDLAEPDELENGDRILRLPMSAWLVAKIEAFEERGRRDMLVSKDLEDIATLMIGRRNVVQDVQNAHPDIRARCIEAFRQWRNELEVLDALDGCATSAGERQLLAARVIEFVALC